MSNVYPKGTLLVKPSQVEPETTTTPKPAPARERASERERAQRGAAEDDQKPIERRVPQPPIAYSILFSHLHLSVSPELFPTMFADANPLSSPVQGHHDPTPLRHPHLSISPARSRSNGEESIPDPPLDETPAWVERDFLQLFPLPKREAPELSGRDTGINKPKVEDLDLSLSLNPAGPPSDVANNPNLEEIQANFINLTVSDECSYSMSVPFSHNPSCSLMQNLTENYESGGFLYCGGYEGTNGSVHSRFRPVGGDGNMISLANHSKELSNGVCRGNGSESHSFFPSELLAAPVRGNGNASSGNGRTLASKWPERVLRAIVSEPIPLMCQPLQELPDESLEALKDCLRSMMDKGNKRAEFMSLQRQLEMRLDLTSEMLLKCQQTQLDIIVAIKTGIMDFLSMKNRLSNVELVEVFLLTRCRNMSCKSILPVADCNCKICSTKKGFCSACMCPVCLSFDCASNTCSWVGCDVCSHWCHAVCGLQKKLIRPGPSLKGALGMTEMQYHCLGCGHASEVFGFIKEVFMFCAKDWDLETLMKELECVRKIFQGNEDFEGKALQGKAEEMLTMLSKKHVSPVDACNGLLQFFKYGVAGHPVTGSSSKSILTAQESQQGDALPHPPPATTIPPKVPTISLLDVQIDAPKSDTKLLAAEPHFSMPKKEGGGHQSLESIIQLKEAEVKLFQRLADDARKEVERYRVIAHAKVEKLAEEYASKLARLSLQETEERWQWMLQELKFLKLSL